MVPFEKSLKYIAITIAIVFTVSFLGIIFRFFGIFNNILNRDGVVEELKTYIISDDITDLEVDINASSFTVATGSEFSIESNLKYLTVREKGNTLIIRERSNSLIKHDNPVLTLYIPEGFSFKEADITTGAGKVTVNSLVADNLQLELGAGEVVLNNIIATHEADIEGGAGSLTVNGGIFNDLDVQMGVGALNFKSQLTGKSEFDFGVGEANIELIGTKDDYRLEVQKGIGKSYIDGSDIKGGSVYGNGPNLVSLEGGVGSINVTFTEN